MGNISKKEVCSCVEGTALLMDVSGVRGQKCQSQKPTG